jgi:hypothetical protein
MNDVNNEGERILSRLKAADNELTDAVEDKIERQRAFAIWIDGLSPSDRRAALNAIGPKLTKRKLSLWRKADDRGALWEIRRLTD